MQIAGKVYKLLGKEDLGADVWPAASQPIFRDLSYYMHEGGPRHGVFGLERIHRVSQEDFPYELVSIQEPNRDGEPPLQVGP
jgi:hypothetical protein